MSEWHFFSYSNASKILAFSVIFKAFKSYRRIILMSLTPELVKNIALLARLEVQENELPKLQTQLSTILDLLDRVQKEEVGDTLAMANPHDAVQILREDIVSETDQRALYQSIAPATEAGLYLVPKVIE